MLRQSLKDLEVIVIDDCSTDDTEDFVKSIPDKRIRYFKNEKNCGLEYNRMIGFRMTRGKYITWLDDDDYYTDYDFFTKAVNIFRENDSQDKPLAFVCANAEVDNTVNNALMKHRISDNIIGRIRGLDYITAPDIRKPLSTFPTLFSADILRQAGLDNMIIFDTETYLQAALIGDVWIMPESVGVYRLHTQSATLGYTNHPAQNKRIDAKVKAMAQRGVLIAEKLCSLTDKRTADIWCMKAASLLLCCYRGQQSYINELRTYGRAMMIMSRFNRKVLMMALSSETMRLLRKITPLRKLYRFIKYRLRGRPYPEA